MPFISFAIISGRWFPIRPEVFVGQGTVLCPVLDVVLDLLDAAGSVVLQHPVVLYHRTALCGTRNRPLCPIYPVPFTPDIRYKNTSVGLRGKAQRTHVQQALPHSRVELFRSMEDLCHHQRIA